MEETPQIIDIEEEKEPINDNELFQNTEEVGIECFMNDNAPIKNAVLKHRYLDFIVNEIDTSNNFALLSRDADVVSEIDKIIGQANPPQKDIEEEKTEEGPMKIELTEEAAEKAREILKEDADRLLEHIRKINDGLCDRKEPLSLSNHTRCDNFNILDHIEDKERRTQVHKFFKEQVCGFETFTKEIDGEKKVIVLLKDEMSKNKRRKLKMYIEKVGLKNNWLQTPNYKFVMMKENIESMQAIHNMSRLIKKQAKNFGIAGNKDKRGVTFQFVTISHAKYSIIVKFLAFRILKEPRKILNGFKR
jgi:tRNA pseudouridine13 synthase